MSKAKNSTKQRDAVILVFSNLREMDWIKAVITDMSEDHRLIVLTLYPVEQDWLNRYKSPNVSIYNTEFNKPIDIFKAIWNLLKSMKFSKSKVMIAHGFYASLAAVTAGKLRFLKKVVTVRHHGRGHYENPVLNALDRYISQHSYRLFAISELTRNLFLAEGVPERKIYQLPNAIDVSRFSSHSKKSRKEFLNQFGFNESHFVIGVLSRFVDSKGINYTLEAFSRLLELAPHARLILANAHGTNELLDNLIQSTGEKFIVKIKDIGEVEDFYKSLDVFVHTPISFDAEPSGLVYLESLASGVNTIFTKSGVALELDGLENYSWIVDFENSVEIENAIKSIMHGEAKDKITAEYLSRFTIQAYVENFRSIYTEISEK
jgi:glycosyltransferase involved in cell wall biosynthesis